jgi:hypothetical protein
VAENTCGSKINNKHLTMLFKIIKIFILVFLALFILSVVTGFPDVIYTHNIFEGQTGTGESYILNLSSLPINLASSLLAAAVLTACWFFFKRPVPAR